MNTQAALAVAKPRVLLRTVRRSQALSDARINLDALPADGIRAGTGGEQPDGAVSRAVDIVLSLAMLAVAIPVMVIVAVLIKLDSRGPAIYRQERLGLHGKPFTVLKFRSMRQDAEACGPKWASLRDPRVTRVGAFLRATRLDELPQLWNVLKGDMALIGPRPERPNFVESLASEIPHFRQRMMVKPGLTGWAQVNFRYGASVEDARTKLSYDLYYVKHRSFWMHVRIVLSTAKVVVCREGR